MNLFIILCTCYYEISIDWSEILKLTLPTITSILTVLGAYYLTKSKEDKRTSDKRNLLLLNLVEHVKKIVTDCNDLLNLNNKFIAEVRANPFDEVFLDKQLIPDLDRVIRIDNQEIFALLYEESQDKIQAAKNFRILFNSLEFINQTIHSEYKRYDLLIEEVYKQKLKFKSGVDSMRLLCSEVINKIQNLSGDFSIDPIYNILNRGLLNYFDKLGTDNKPLEFHARELLIPLRDELLPYKNNDMVYPILLIIKENLNRRDDIINDSLSIANMVELLNKNFRYSLDEMNKILPSLESICSQFLSNNK